MADEQTSFRNDFEREFWAKVYLECLSKWLNPDAAAEARANAALAALRARGTCVGRDATSLVSPTNEQRHHRSVEPELKTGMHVVHRRTGARYVLREISGDTATVTWETIAREEVPLAELIEEKRQYGEREASCTVRQTLDAAERFIENDHGT